MRSIALGYTYRPAKASPPAKEKALYLKLTPGLILKLILLVLLLLPWGFTAYRYHQLQSLEREIKKEKALAAKLASEWNSLTAEEVVRAKVAPLGLFKPTEKEVIRLP